MNDDFEIPKGMDLVSAGLYVARLLGNERKRFHVAGNRTIH